jgi:hypothetical protein
MEKRQRSTEWMTRKSGAILGLSASPIFVLFLLLGYDVGRAEVAWVSAASIVGVARQLWDLRTRVWFWAVLAVIVVANLLVLPWIPWPATKSSYIALLPIGLAHFGIVRGVFWLVERILEPPVPQSVEPPAPVPPA